MKNNYTENISVQFQNQSNITNTHLLQPRNFNNTAQLNKKQQKIINQQKNKQKQKHQTQSNKYFDIAKENIFLNTRKIGLDTRRRKVQNYNQSCMKQFTFSNFEQLKHQIKELERQQFVSLQQILPKPIKQQKIQGFAKKNMITMRIPTSIPLDKQNNLNSKKMLKIPPTIIESKRHNRIISQRVRKYFCSNHEKHEILQVNSFIAVESKKIHSKNKSGFSYSKGQYHHHTTSLL